MHISSDTSRKLRAGVGMVAMVMAIATANPVWAQDDASNSAAGEIIVTAQRKEQRLQDVPVSVTITTGETLARNNINDLQDLAFRLPSVRLSTAPGANLINIRGVGSGINAGFEQSVGTFVDGVYRGRSRSAAAALFDLERIEVLKGPQTTYFGNNVIAGALNITTRKPGKELSVNASALYAPGHGEYALEAGVDLPVSDNLRFRVAGKAFGMDGWLSNTLTREKEPHRRDWIGRVSMAAEPLDNWKVEARVDRGRMRDGGYIAAELIDCPPGAPFPAQPGPPQPSLCNVYLGQNAGNVDDEYNGVTAYQASFYNLDFTEAALTNRVTLSDHVLTFVTGYYKHDNHVQSEGIPLPVQLAPLAATTSYLLGINVYEKAEQFSQELRLEGPTGGLVEYTLGAYYGHEKIDAPQYSSFHFAPFGALVGLSPTLPVGIRNAYRQTTNTYSPFAALTVNASERLKINLGARYTVVNKTAFNDITYGTAVPFNTAESFVPFPATQTSPTYLTPESLLTRLDTLLVAQRGNFAVPSRSFKKLMPSVNVQYEITPDVSTYASFSNGFKAGGFAVALKRNPFNSETVNAYEVGLKANLLDRRLFLTLAAFRSDYKGLQEAVQNILPAFPGTPPGNLATALPARIDATVSNAASARVQGVEMSLNLKAADWISFNADVAYLDAKYGNYAGAPCSTIGNVLGAAEGCVGGVQDLAGKRKGYAPEWSGNIGAHVTIPVDDGFQITLDPSMYFTSNYFYSSTADPLFSQPAYAKIDLRGAIGSPDGSWELAVIAKNLTNKKTGSFRNGISTSSGSYYIATERPRSVAFQFTLKM